MSEPSHLDQWIRVCPRFARSISLARDAHRENALEGYILTPAGRDVLCRMTEALRGDSPTRAWSLTGPYGSGKSAFALFAAQLLGGESAIRQRARAFLAETDAELSEQLFDSGGPMPKKAGRLFPVVVTGSRQPLEKALAAGLAAALRRIARTNPPQLVKRLERLAQEPGPSGTAIVGLFEEANEYLERHGNEARGILLLVDELGKFLEYGASNPEQGDVFVLQELAEAATRSQRPFLFLTILHQSIDRYADHLSPGRRAEWAKVQGRFEDVPFEERTEQLLRPSYISYLYSHLPSWTVPAQMIRMRWKLRRLHRMNDITDERQLIATAPEDLFTTLFSQVFGLEKTALLVPQLPVDDIYGGSRFVDFALRTIEERVAFEIDGLTWHVPDQEAISKYEDDLLRQNSLIHQGWRVFRWTDRQIAHEPEQV